MFQYIQYLHFVTEIKFLSTGCKECLFVSGQPNKLQHNKSFPVLENICEPTWSYVRTFKYYPAFQLRSYKKIKKSNRTKSEFALVNFSVNYTQYFLESPNKHNYPSLSVFFHQSELHSWVDIAVHLQPSEKGPGDWRMQTLVLPSAAQIGLNDIGLMPDDLLLHHSIHTLKKDTTKHFKITIITQLERFFGWPINVGHNFKLLMQWKSDLTFSRTELFHTIKPSGVQRSVTMTSLQNNKSSLFVVWLNNSMHSKIPELDRMTCTLNVLCSSYSRLNTGTVFMQTETDISDGPCSTVNKEIAMRVEDDRLRKPHQNFWKPSYQCSNASNQERMSQLYFVKGCSSLRETVKFQCFQTESMLPGFTQEKLQDVAECTVNKVPCLKYSSSRYRTDIIVMNYVMFDFHFPFILYGNSYCLSSTVDRKKTWTEASALCRAVGGTLPVLRDRLEIDELTSYFKYSMYLPPTDVVFVGLSMSTQVSPAFCIHSAVHFVQIVMSSRFSTTQLLLNCRQNTNGIVETQLLSKNGVTWTMS